MYTVIGNLSYDCERTRRSPGVAEREDDVVQHRLNNTRG